MGNNSLGFSFNMDGMDRDTLLNDAAERLDALAGYLGDIEEDSTPSPERKAVEELMGDVVRFAGFPVVYKITDQDFLTRHLSIPVRFRDLTRTYNFYSVYFPIALFPRHNGSFNRLEMSVKFNPDETVQHTRPKAYQILPAKKFLTQLELRGHIEVGMDGNFEFSAQGAIDQVNLGVVGGQASAGIDAKLAAGTGAVIGPFVYRIKRAKIDHTAIGLEEVFWRLDGAEFFQEDDPPLIVIMQVPKETQAVNITAQLQVYRYFHFLGAELQEMIRELPRAIRDFFTGGMPIRRDASWDITPRL